MSQAISLLDILSHLKGWKDEMVHWHATAFNTGYRREGNIYFLEVSLEVADPVYQGGMEWHKETLRGTITETFQVQVIRRMELLKNADMLISFVAPKYKLPVWDEQEI